MNTPEQPAPSAQDAYQQRYREIGELLLRISTKLSTDYHSLDQPTWADVGDQGHVIAVLKDLAEFLGI